jgi:hypothetical protein
MRCSRELKAPCPVCRPDSRDDFWSSFRAMAYGQGY